MQSPDDLYQALESGSIAGAAADVDYTEFPGGRKLLELPNFINTPHAMGLSLPYQGHRPPGGGILVGCGKDTVRGGIKADCSGGVPDRPGVPHQQVVHQPFRSGVPHRRQGMGLLELPNFINTPHAMAFSWGSLRRSGMNCVRELCRVLLEGKEPKYWVVDHPPVGCLPGDVERHHIRLGKYLLHGVGHPYVGGDKGRVDVAKHICEYDRKVRTPEGIRAKMALELEGATIGLLGLGNIALPLSSAWYRSSLFTRMSRAVLRK